MTLAQHEQPQVAIAKHGEDAEATARANLLQSIADGRISSENAKAAIELYKEILAIDAKKAFNKAFAIFQSEMPAVVATRIIPDNSGNARSKFAAYEDIKRQIQPLLSKHGFSLTGTTEFGADRVFARVTLRHIGGHEIVGEFACRYTTPPKASNSQADGATASYAKRYALCHLLDIPIDKDNDGAAIGATDTFITPEQATALWDRVEALSLDPKGNKRHASFLRYAKAADYTKILADDYERVESQLTLIEQKEKANAKPQ